MPRNHRRPSQQDRVRAEHILALAQEAITQFAEVSESQFAARRLYQTSLAWYLQAIGEAASRISEESRALVPGIPWRQVVGTRHILSHEYDRLRAEKLWKVLRVHLPAMVANLRAHIHRLPAGSITAPPPASPPP
jgi:uncharacterized protein with HEPN domain